MSGRDWAALEPCGTAAAYKRHLRQGKPVRCVTCLQGEARRWQDKDQAAKEARYAIRRQRYAEARAAGLSPREANRARSRRAA